MYMYAMFTCRKMYLQSVGQDCLKQHSAVLIGAGATMGAMAHTCNYVYMYRHTKKYHLYTRDSQTVAEVAS